MTTTAGLMDWITGLGGLAGVAALVGIIWTVRHGVKADGRAAAAQEAEIKRDTIADRDAHIDQLQEDVVGLRAEVARLTTLVRDQGADLEEERAYNRVLIEHIYRGLAPPPPPRPPRTFRP